MRGAVMYAPGHVRVDERDERDEPTVQKSTDAVDLEISLDDIAEGYQAMDERRAITALVRL